MKKNLLIYAHYFYPDVASTGQVLTELAEGLQDRFNITVISVVPSYDGNVDEKYKTNRIYFENYKNIKMVRVRVPEFQKTNKMSRIKNILAYFFNAIIATFKVGKQDIVFSISQPPILGGLLGSIGKKIKKARFVYNIQDFNPEQSAAVGYMNKHILSFAKVLDKHSCRKADKIIVVGRDMQETLNERFKDKKVPPNIFINNWADEKNIYPLEKDNSKVLEFRKNYGLENKFIIMYSGNLGLYYDLENIITCLKDFSHYEDVAFVFIGAGSVKDKLVKYKEDNNMKNVYFLPYQKKEDLIYSLNSADIHFVINAKGIKGVSVPSKLYGVMACAKPILAVLEEGSEARLIIEEADCGHCVNVEDYEAVKNAISNIINNRNLIENKGLNGRKFLEAHLKKDISINKYAEAISELL